MQTNHVWKSSPPAVFYKETSLAPSLFNDVYSEQIAKWEHCCQEEDRDAEYLHAKFFFTGDIHDMHPEALQRLSQPVEK